MKLGLVSIWHNGGPGGDHLHQRYFELWKRCVEKWKSYVDHIYLIDSNWGFTDLDMAWLEDNFPGEHTIFNWKGQSHWDNMEEAIHHVKEDSVLTLDLDTYVYDPELIKGWRDLLYLEGLDVLSIWDSSGSDILDPPPTVGREMRRIAPYLMFANTNSIQGLSWRPFNKGDIWFDSFGQATRFLVNNEYHLGQISDNRMTLYIEDGVDFSEPENIGYYHVRNWSKGVWMVRHNRLNEQEMYKTMMPREAMRLLGWFSMVGNDDQNINQYIDRVVQDFNYSPAQFWEYVKELKRFHPWVERLLHE